MHFEVLYFEGCPTYMVATQTLREVVFELGGVGGGALVAVDSEEEAQQLRFPGSPTIRVDGRDLFPVQERGIWALGCRAYATPEGLEGYPTREMIWEALAR